MVANHRRILMAAGIIGLVVLACNYPRPAVPTQDMSGTAAADTLGALETGDALPQPAASGAFTPAPIGSGTIPAVTLPPSENPLVIQDALCWVGPGNQYEVVSAVRAGTTVQLLGRGTIPGWFIIRNPIYQDPCWVPTADLQVSPNVDLSGLPYFSPPPTPTLTPSKTPRPTSTPTATSTP